jgi:bacterial/archaeal transporter family-2 protein
VDRLLAVLATVAAGGVIALQPVVNSVLGKSTSALGATFIGFVSGTIVLFVLLVVAGQLSTVKGATDVDWIYWTGGLMGVVIVGVSLVTVRELGAAGVVAATICGQLTLSLVLDYFGVLGLEKVGLTPDRVIGVALLAAGTFLLTR